MATELADIKTFVDSIDATTTVNEASTKGSLKNAGAAPKIFINIPEIINIDLYSKEITYRYLLECVFLTDTTLTTALKALISNIDKLTRRATIAGYTKPTTLVRISMADIGKIEKIKSLWKCEIYLEAVWSET